jgi:hypothetical protein
MLHYRQGDEERERGLAVTKLMDRRTTSVKESQVRSALARARGIVVC